MGGGNAWAEAGDVTTNVNIDFSNAIVDGVVTGTKNSMTLSRVDGDQPFELGYNEANMDVLRVGKGTGTVIIDDKELAGERDKVVVSFDYYYGKLSGKKAAFELLDASNVRIAGFSRDVYSSITAYDTFGLDASKITSVGSGSESNAAILAASNKTTYVITLDYSTSTITIAQSTNGVVKQTIVGIEMTNTNPLKKFVVSSDYNNNDRRCWFDNLLIQTTEGDYSAVPTSYSVQYQDVNGNTIKEANTGIVTYVGSNYTAGAADTEAFFNNDGTIKYVYKSGNSVKVAVEEAASNVITLVFDEYEKRNFTVKAVDGGGNDLDKILYQSSVYADAATNVGFTTPLYVLHNNTLYSINTNWSTVDVTSNDQVIGLKYNTAFNNVAFYSEVEEISGSSAITAQNASMGKIGRTTYSARPIIANLPAGVYELYTVAHAGNGKTTDTYNATFYKGDDLFATFYFKGRTNNQTYSTLFSLDTDTDVKFECPTGNATGLDYIYIKSVSSVPVTIGDAGWATYVTPCAVDFTDNAIKAYAVSEIGAESVTLTELTTVPAGQAIIVNGTSGNVNVAASAPAITNLMEKTTEPTAATGQLVLAQVDGEVVFAPATSGTIAAGKGYLTVQNPARLRMVIGGEANGISDVNVNAVAAPAKYVVNGKLVIEKAGKMFNAAGAQIK